MHSDAPRERRSISRALKIPRHAPASHTGLQSGNPSPPHSTNNPPATTEPFAHANDRTLNARRKPL